MGSSNRIFAAGIGSRCPQSDVLFELATTLRGTSREQESLSYYHQLLALQPQHAGALDHLLLIAREDTRRRFGKELQAMLHSSKWSHILQRPEEFIPGLDTKAWWGHDNQDLSRAANFLSESHAIVKSELLGLLESSSGDSNATKGKMSAQTIDAFLLHSKDPQAKWWVFNLVSGGQQLQSNCAHCPGTCQLVKELSKMPQIKLHFAQFSLIPAGSQIKAHCGPTNARLKIHLGVLVPDDAAWIRVGDETRQLLSKSRLYLMAPLSMGFGTHIAVSIELF